MRLPHSKNIWFIFFFLFGPVLFARNHQTDEYKHLNTIDDDLIFSGGDPSDCSIQFNVSPFERPDCINLVAAGNPFSNVLLEIGFLFIKPMDIRQTSNVLIESCFQKAPLKEESVPFKFETSQQEIIDARSSSDQVNLSYF